MRPIAMQIQQIVLASHPQGMPTLTDFQLADSTLPAVSPGQVLVRATHVSVDPYLRSLMKEGAVFRPHQPLVGALVGVVAESQAEGFAVGDTVVGNLPWATHALATPGQLQKADTSELPASAYLGLLGMPGLTAYFGLELAQLQAGETLVVSGAAGAIGTIIGQVGKLKGCRVIGIAGSDEKARQLKATGGYSEVINYKTQDVAQELAAHCPDGIAVYFDNVGGAVSAAVLPLIQLHARVVVCGQIATYNEAGSPQAGFDLLPLILNKAAWVQGYHVSDYPDRFPEAVQQLTAWYRQGQVTIAETVLDGFDKLPEAFVGLFTGQNTGKMLVKV
ncbi:MAG: NADP-dependent oxidoreductase [Janthinobacterium lividum]